MIQTIFIKRSAAASDLKLIIMEKYVIFVVPDDEVFLPEDTTYDEIEVMAIDRFISDKLEDILQWMVEVVNNNVGTSDFYYVCDREEREILYQ